MLCFPSHISMGTHERVMNFSPTAAHHPHRAIPMQACMQACLAVTLMISDTGVRKHLSLSWLTGQIQGRTQALEITMHVNSLRI